jgi:imidazolonepropionase-like amidohydrolase
MKSGPFILAALAGLLAVGCGEQPPELVRMPTEPPAALWIDNVDVFDSVSGRVDHSRDVLIRDGKIDAIAAHGQLVAPADADTIDGRGATLLPGLIDAHTHLESAPFPPWQLTLPDHELNLRAYLYCGVTTLFDTGESDAAAATSRRDAIAAGQLIGPRVFTAGRLITARGGHPVAMARQILPWWLAWYILPQLAHEIGSEEEARSAVRTIYDSGADVVKIVVDSAPADAPRIRPDEIRAAADQARALGIRTVTHIGTFNDAVDAARGGSAAWLHGVYKHRLTDAQVGELAAYGIPMAPTLTVFDSYATVLDDNRIATALEKETAAPAALNALDNIPLEHPAIEPFRDYIALLKRNRQPAKDNARRLFEAGVTMFAGSDPQSGVFAGPGLHRELLLMSEAGIPNAEVLRAATIHPARFLSQQADPDFGVVAAGKHADLLLVDGDPVADISRTSEIREVIVGGVRLEREAAVSAN